MKKKIFKEFKTKMLTVAKKKKKKKDMVVHNNK